MDGQYWALKNPSRLYLELIVGETRVDLHHMLEDLRYAYTGAREETILTEVAANSLNSDTTAVGDNVQLYDFVFVGQAGFAALASSFTEYKNKS